MLVGDEEEDEDEDDYRFGELIRRRKSRISFFSNSFDPDPLLAASPPLSSSLPSLPLCLPPASSPPSSGLQEALLPAQARSQPAFSPNQPGSSPSITLIGTRGTSPTHYPPHSPPPAAVRSSIQLRRRKPNQLNPFTLEARCYTRALIAKDWQDAVILPANGPGRSRTPRSPLPPSSSEEESASDAEGEVSQESEPGHTLADSEIGQFVKRNFHRRRIPSDRPARHNQPRFRPLSQVPHKRSRPASGSPHRSTPLSVPSPVGRARPGRASLSEEPPLPVGPKTLSGPRRHRTHRRTSDPEPGRTSRWRKRQKGLGYESASLDLPSRDDLPSLGRYGRASVDPYVRITGRPQEAWSLDSRTLEDGESSEQGEGEAIEEEDEQSVADIGASKLKLKLLKRMMPGSYVTKALKDLRLMQMEKRRGQLRLTAGSDDESDRGASDGPQVRPATKANPCRRLVSNRAGPSTAFHSVPRERPDLIRSHSHHLSGSSPIRPDTSPPLSPFDVNPAVRSASGGLNTIHTSVSTSIKDDYSLWRTFESANRIQSAFYPPKNSNWHDDFTLAHLRAFSADFGIQKLPVGLRLRVQLDYLPDQSLSERLSSKPCNRERSLTSTSDHKIWGISFSFRALSLVELSGGLSSLIDRIQDELLSLLSMEAQSRSTTHRAVNTVWNFFNFLFCHLTAIEGSAEILMNWAVDLIQRIDDLVIDMINRVEFSELLLVVVWSSFELTCRLIALNSDQVHNHGDCLPSEAHSTDVGNQFLECLIRRLLEFGPPLTMTRLKKSVADFGSAGMDEVHDLSLEIWSRLINLVVSQSHPGSLKLAFLGQRHFWDVLTTLTRSHADSIELGVVARGEVLSYLAMMTCAISQFDFNGTVNSASSKMQSYWRVLLDSLGSVPDNIFAEAYDPKQRIKRDQYLRSIFARALIFNQRWQWPLELDDGIIEKMYKILNANKLERLPIELHDPKRFGEIDSFPDALRGISKLKISHQGVTGLDHDLKPRHDTCFGMFLKVLIRATHDMNKPPAISKEKEVEKVISRCNPLRQLSFKPIGALGLKLDPRITAQNRSNLIHHASLFLMYSILFPKTLKRQLSYLERLCKFDQLDRVSRKSYLKIWKKVGKVFHKIRSEQTSLFVGVVIGKAQTALRVLVGDYIRVKELERRVRDRLRPCSSSSISRESLSGIQNATTEALKGELCEIIQDQKAKVLLVAEVLKFAEDIIETWARNEDEAVWLYPSETWIDFVCMIESEESLAKERSVIAQTNRTMNSLLKLRFKNVRQDQGRRLRVEELEGQLRAKTDVRDDQQQESLEMDEDENCILEIEETRRARMAFEAQDAKLAERVRENDVKLSKILEAGLVVDGGVSMLLADVIRNWAWIDRIRKGRMLVDCVKSMERFIEERGCGIEVLAGYVMGLFEVEEEDYMELREEVLRIWLGSMVSLEYTIQGPFSRRIAELESTFVIEDQGGCRLLPEKWEWGSCFNWWDPSGVEDSLALESRRMEFFGQMFSEVCDRLRRWRHSLQEVGFKQRVKFYQRRIGELAESISSTNRKLIKRARTHHNSRHSSSSVGAVATGQRWLGEEQRPHGLMNTNTNNNSEAYLGMMKTLVEEKVLAKLGGPFRRWFDFNGVPKLWILKPLLGLQVLPFSCPTSTTSLPQT